MQASTEKGYPPQNYPPQQGFQPAQNYAPSTAPTHWQPPQQQQPPPPPPITVVVQNDGWCSRNQRNKPQSNAAGATALIFLSGGMNVAYCVGFRSGLYGLLPLHTRAAWFIGAIIGAFISGFLANKVPKKFVFMFSAVLVLIGGIIVAATKMNVEAVEASLYLDGIANGLSFAPTLALAGEVSVSYMRGCLTASIEQLSFAMGFLIQIVYTVSWSTSTHYNDFGANQMKGVLSSIYGFIALLIATFLCIESPVIMLANGEEEKAIDAMRRLQMPNVITTETYQQLEEHKRYLAQNKHLSNMQSIAQGLPAFLKLSYLRALNAMSLSSYVYLTLWLSILKTYSVGDVAWQFIVFAGCRWVGPMICAFAMETAGRKKPTLIGLLIAGGMAFGIGNLVSNAPFGPLDTIFPLLCIFAVFSGIAFTATSPYLSEAFPLGVKQHFIAFTFIVEMLIYIIILCCDFSFNGGGIFFYIMGVLYVCGFLLGIFCLPETRLTTLRESQDKFKGLLSKGF